MSTQRQLRFGLGSHLMAVALLPILAIVLTLIALFFALNELEETRLQQQRRRVAIQSMAKLVPDRIANAVSTYGELEDIGQRNVHDVEKNRTDWRDTFQKIELGTTTAATKERLHQMAWDFGMYEGETLRLHWLGEHGGKALAPLEYGDVAGAATHWVIQTPAQVRELMQMMWVESQADRKELEAQTQLGWIAVIGFGATLLSGVASIAFFSTGINRRLRLLGENAERLAGGKTLLPPTGATDEIGTLDKNFHDMARTLAEARHEEQAAISNSADMICVLDDSGRITDVNPACRALLGVSREELIGTQLIDRIADDSRVEFVAQIAGMKNSLELHHFETVLAGDSLDVLVSGYYSAEDRSVFCVIHNIAARKEIERLVQAGETRERLLMERIPAGLIHYDAGGNVLAANSRAAEMLAAQNVGVAQFTRDLMVRARDNVSTISLGSGDTKCVLQVSVREVDGGQNSLAVILDQTEREQFKDMRARFLSMIAHDIATPLTNIAASFNLYAIGVHGELTEAGRKKVEAAESESLRLVRLFRELLRAEKEGAVELQIGAEPVDLRELVQQAVDGVSEQAERDGIAIALESAECRVNADPDRLVQMFVNLLTNALKFSPAGSTVRMALVADEQTACVNVSDEGPGIPADMLDTIFEPYKQASVEDRTVRGGSGLGLAICKQIVTAHGGTIRAANGEFCGAIFTVRLPLSH